MNKRNKELEEAFSDDDSKKLSKKTKQIIGAFMGITAIIAAIFFGGYTLGAHVDKPNAPMSCRRAFDTIAQQLDGSKDATAAAIRGTNGPENKDAEITKLVTECLGELPPLPEPSTTTTTTVVPPTTVAK